MANDEDAFKVGDRVNINTDEGPDMVISKIETEGGVEKVTCIWFEDHRPGGNQNPIWILKEAVVPLDVLIAIE